MTDAEQATTPAAKPASHRAKYAVLGLFPFLLVTLLVGVLVAAMHQPTPNNLPVAVVGGTVQQGRSVAEAMEKKAGDALDVRVLSSRQTAERQVTHQKIAGAYILPTSAGGQTTLYVAGADGASLKGLTTQVFQQVAQEQKAELQVKDLVPLPDRDSLGVTSLYLTIGFALAGFVFTITVSTAARELLPLSRFVPVIAAYAVFMSVCIWAVVGPAIGAFHGHAAKVLGLGWLTVFCSAMVTSVLARYMGPLASVPAALLFMFLGVPASGGGLTTYAEPGLFQTLHGALPTPAAVESLRSVLYFDGQGVAGHVEMLALWTVGAMVLNLSAELVRRRQGKAAVPALAFAAH